MLHPHPVMSTQWPPDASMAHRLNEKQKLGPCVCPERQVWRCSQEAPEGTASSREREALDLKTITHRCFHKCDSYVTRQCGHHLPPGNLLEAAYLSEFSGLTKMWCECPQWSPPACIPFSPSPSISLGSLSRVSSFGLSLTASSSQSRRGGHRKVAPTISLMSPVVQPLRLAGAHDAHILALPTWQHQ